MTQGPPQGGGPPGWAPVGAAPQDPYGTERTLVAWAAERGFELSAPDFNFLGSWLPIQFVGRIASATRQLNASFGQVRITVFEVVEDDPVKQVTGDARQLLFLLMSPSIKFRVSVQAKNTGNLGDEVSRGFKELGNLFNAAPRAQGPLGDPALESRFDVLFPSVDEGQRALTVPLRHHLINLPFRGRLELRVGGMVVLPVTHRSFDPATLDNGLQLVGSLFHAAIA